MKILHTSDWHIGQRFYGYERDDEHAWFFGQLAEIMRAERPDALLVSGDVYDTVAPSAQSQRMLVHALMNLHCASPSTRIIITAGNHDSGSRLDALRRLWAEVGVTVVGSCVRDEDGICDPSQFVVAIPGKGAVAAVPYFSSRAYPAVRADVDRSDRQKAFFQSVIDCARSQAADLPVVMMAHLTVSGSIINNNDGTAIGGIEADDIATLGRGYDYLALGHIHKPQNVGRPRTEADADSANGCAADANNNGRAVRARYCGSPFPMSFAEDYTHYVDIVEIDGHDDAPTVLHMGIDPLRRMLTIPDGGAPLDDALEAFAALDDDCGDYVRLLVDQDGLLPADADERANAIARGKSCRYCEIKKVAKPLAEGVGHASAVLEIDEIRALSPLDIAAQAYERKTGAPMPDALRALMAEVIAGQANDDREGGEI